MDSNGITSSSLFRGLTSKLDCGLPTRLHPNGISVMILWVSGSSFKASSPQGGLEGIHPIGVSHFMWCDAPSLESLGPT